MTDEKAAGKQPVRSKVRHPELARRFEIAVRDHPHVPPPNYGRLKWVVEQFSSRFGEVITEETVRKWLNGEAAPRRQNMARLAEIFGVDEAWLAIGAERIDPKWKRVRNAQADGAVNLVAGMIRMDGGKIAFPEEGGRNGAAHPEADMFAIIRGGHYVLHVVAAVRSGDGWAVTVAPGALDDSIFILAVLPLGGFSYRIIEVGEEELRGVGQRTRRGLEFEVDGNLRTGDVQWREVTGFSERL